LEREVAAIVGGHQFVEHFDVAVVPAARRERVMKHRHGPAACFKFVEATLPDFLAIDPQRDFAWPGETALATHVRANRKRNPDHRPRGSVLDGGDRQVIRRLRPESYKE